MKILSAFFADWRTTGAVAATSRFATKTMLATVDWKKVRVVCDVGAGTGCISRRVLRHMMPDAKLFAVEINPRLTDLIRNEVDDSRLTVIQGSAADLHRLLPKHGVDGADLVLCSLPFSTIDRGLRHEIMHAINHSLSPGGQFVVLQYSARCMPRLLRHHFGHFRVRRNWLNIPPALIYTCTRASSGGTA